MAIKAPGAASEGGLTKSERLLKTKDFHSVYRKGRSFKKDRMVLCCRPNNLPYSRIGFSISSRIIKLAYRRNKLRRILKESFRLHKSCIKSGFDMVIVVKADNDSPIIYKTIEDNFFGLLRKAGLF